VFEKEDLCGKKTHVTFTRNEIEKKLGIECWMKDEKKKGLLYPESERRKIHSNISGKR
jgi:hypothetical protein